MSLSVSFPELVVVLESVFFFKAPDLPPSAGEDVSLLASRVVLVSVSVVPAMITRKLPNF